MTMKRSDKAGHTFELRIAAQNWGYVPTEWQRPTERRARVAELGHAMMTAAEYRTHRMGRRSRQEHLARETWGREARRARRRLALAR